MEDPIRRRHERKTPAAGSDHRAATLSAELICGAGRHGLGCRLGFPSRTARCRFFCDHSRTKQYGMRTARLCGGKPARISSAGLRRGSDRDPFCLKPATIQKGLAFCVQWSGTVTVSERGVIMAAQATKRGMRSRIGAIFAKPARVERLPA